MRLRLLVPEDVDRPTGGNVYDREIAAALTGLGVRVELVRATTDTLREQLAGSAYPIVDGLLASGEPEACRGAGVLLHMPLAWRDPAAAELERRTLGQASLVVTTSQHAAGFVAAEYGLERIVVVPPGVTTAPVTAEVSPPLIAQVAAWTPNKNQLVTVAALAAVRDLPWLARLAGAQDADPGYAAAVLGAIGSAGLSDRVRCPGTMSADRVWDQVSLAVLPSHHEAFGMVVTEALARGIPSIVAGPGPAEALGRTNDGRVPGAVLAAPESMYLGRAVRRWLTDHDWRTATRAAALDRRAALTGWDVAARTLRDAIAERGLA
ncbi:MAG: glycosyltransferase family 4 protein [Nocardioides sp.]